MIPRLLQRGLARLVAWALADELDRIAVDRVTLEDLRGRRQAQADRLSRAEHKLHDLQVRFYRVELAAGQLKALQAIDVGYRERGKVIILAHVGGQDIVRTIDTRASFAVVEYKRLVAALEHDFGARVAFVDAPDPRVRQQLRDPQA